MQAQRDLKDEADEILEDRAKTLSLDLADKLDKNEISLEDMASEIDNFLTGEKND